MKLLHTGDLHLGKMLGEFDIEDEQRYILKQIIGIAKEKGAAALLIAGDVYDRSIPSEAATRLLDEFLNTLVAEKIKVFMISGNHDSDERLNFGSAIFENSDIYISSKYDGRLFKKTLEDEYGPVDIFLMPFVKASQVRHFHETETIENYDDAVRAVIKNSDADFSRREVMVAHQFVAGRGAGPQLGGSEGPMVKNVGTVESVGYDCFDGFDYVALGHIHSPQKIGREQVRYSGSPLKYSEKEAGNDKSVVLVTLGEKGEVQTELIPLKPKRDLRHIKGKKDELLKTENITETDDYIYVTLTDEEPIENAMGIFRQYYPNMLKINYDNSHSRGIQNPDFAEFKSEKPFAELISDFYRSIYGEEISAEELGIMREIAGEAGVDVETD